MDCFQGEARVDDPSDDELHKELCDILSFLSYLIFRSTSTTMEDMAVVVDVYLLQVRRSLKSCSDS